MSNAVFMTIFTSLENNLQTKMFLVGQTLPGIHGDCQEPRVRGTINELVLSNNFGGRIVNIMKVLLCFSPALLSVQPLHLFPSTPVPCSRYHVSLSSLRFHLSSSPSTSKTVFHIPTGTPLLTPPPPGMPSLLFFFFF